MSGVKLDGPVFCEGDGVVLSFGPYQGTPGVFLRLTEDANWAEIAERNGSIRSHPVDWLVPFAAVDSSSARFANKAP